VALGRGAVSRGEVHLVALDPTRGSEIRKTRPCLIVSPDELNHHLRTVIVAPMTTGGHAYPWRIPCRFQNTAGFLVRRLGRLAPRTLTSVLATLQETFVA